MTTPLIDEMLYPTWLTVCQLRNGWQVDDGPALYRNARAQVDSVRTALGETGLSNQDRDHIIYAQCALLDGAVMNRKNRDAGYNEWLKLPLQTHYFNTLGAGEQLWERIRTVLHQPAPNIAVLTCFHRVLLLGFSGQYRDDEAPDREAVLAELNRLVPPLSVAEQTPLVVRPPARRYRRGTRTVWWRFLLAGAAIGLLWWGLNLNLQQFVQQQLW